MDLEPPVNRSMRDLDRAFFKKTVPVTAAQIEARKTGELLKAPTLRGHILDIPKITNVIRSNDGDDAKRLLLLDANNPDQLAPEARQYLNSEGAKLVSHSIELDYDYWTADQILRAVLPPELGDGSPTAFSINGHIAHMNLRDEYLPYRSLIGQVILDKNKTIRTVVNKLDIIDTEFRFFKMEVLAGEPDFIIKHNESGCTFTLDFSTVYWNSRLAHEHERLVNLFTKSDGQPRGDEVIPSVPLVADVFAGVGPFAVPAAKRGAIVYANDLNQESTKWMQVNVQNNKVVPRVRISTLDGRQFIQDVVQTAWTTPFPPEAYIKPLSVKERRSKRAAAKNAHSVLDTDTDPKDVPGPEQTPLVNESAHQPPPGCDSRRIDHFVMNLPATAIEFLDAFRPAFTLLRNLYGKDVQEVYKAMPMVHVHCFTRELEEENAHKDIVERAEAALGCAITKSVLLHHVRKVAPNKEMYCLSFQLPSTFVDGQI